MDHPINLDIKRSSRVSSNLWALGILLVSVISAYAAWRDLRESDKTQAQEIVQTQTTANERYVRQERHFEYSDARISDLEKKSAAAESLMGVIANDVGWLRRRQENQDRQDAKASSK